MNKYILKAAIVIAGAGLGFAYYYFIGCRSGACPITSNPWISTGYGSILGLVIASGLKKDNRNAEQESN